MEHVEPYYPERPERPARTVAMYHGLGGRPTRWEDRMLRRAGFSDVIFDHIDYDREWFRDECRSLFRRELAKIRRADVIIGISLGGYMAYLLAQATGKDLIMINPSLDREKTKLDIKHFNTGDIGNHFNRVEIYFGELDELIPMDNQVNFLNRNHITYNAWIVNGMEHCPYMQEFELILANSPIVND